MVQMIHLQLMVQLGLRDGNPLAHFQVQVVTFTAREGHRLVHKTDSDTGKFQIRLLCHYSQMIHPESDKLSRWMRPQEAPN